MALSANRTVQFKLPTSPVGFRREYQVAAAVHIYQGAHVGLGADGYLKPLVAVAVATTLTGGDRYVGIADEDVDNSSGSAGDETCIVLVAGAYEHAVSGLAITDVGCPVYCSADGTLTKVSLGNAFAGWVENFVSSGNGVIRMPGLGPAPIFNRWSPSIETVAANKALLVHATENHNGLLVLWAGALVTETFAGDTEDQGIITLEDTDGTDITTFTPSDAGADAVNDIVASAANKLAIGAATGSLLAIVAAGKGIQALVSQLTSGANEQGAMKVGVIAVPIA